MIERFSVVGTLDVNKICHKVYDYTKKNQEEPYLFMSKETMNCLYQIYDNIIVEPVTSRHLNGVSAKFDGYKVFVNGDMKFGDIEIR